MKIDFRVRQARASDLEAVIALERSVADAPHWTAAEYEAIGADAGDALRRCLLVAEQFKGEPKDILAGFAVGKLIGAGADAVAELESVVVAAKVRRAGIGRALCEEVIRWCRAAGATSIELEVRSANDGAIALYRDMGFVEEGRRRGYYRSPEDDAVLMRISSSLADG